MGGYGSARTGVAATDCLVLDQGSHTQKFSSEDCWQYKAFLAQYCRAKPSHREPPKAATGHYFP